jgi:hypothetical protein
MVDLAVLSPPLGPGNILGGALKEGGWSGLKWRELAFDTEKRSSFHLPPPPPPTRLARNEAIKRWNVAKRMERQARDDVILRLLVYI